MEDLDLELVKMRPLQAQELLNKATWAQQRAPQKA